MIFKTGQDLHIGVSGETNARTVQIDISEIQRMWPQGRPSLWIKRSGEKAGYPVYTTLSGSVLTWHIGDADVAIPGRGRYEIQMADAQTRLLGKSQTGSVYVDKALTCGDGTPPEAAQSWVAQVLEAADRAEDAADRAEEAGSGVSEEQIADAVKKYFEENPSSGTYFETDETLRLENGTLSVNTADVVEEDNTLPVTSAAVYTEVGNINALLATI